MNVFNKVTLESLKKNRTRTIVTIIGIMLSAAMICASTTLVSSMQPAILQRFCCFIRHLIVPFHNTCTLYQNLPVFKLYLHILKWFSDRTRFMIFRCIVADNRGTF